MAGPLKMRNLLGKSPRKDKKTRMVKGVTDEEEDLVNPQISRLSDLSDESSVEDYGDTTIDGDDTTLDRYHSFERDLRQKHSNACKAMSNGAYHVALEEFESILADLLARYGERHERVGAALHNVAIANLRAGSLDDAMDAIEEAIKIRSRALGRSHPKVADSLVELGIILLSMEEHDDALKVFERALKLRKEEQQQGLVDDDLDENKLKIAKVLNNIGCVNFEKNSLEEARSSFEQAIALQQGVFNSWMNKVCGMDSNSPGLLTMASTMCNKGYVEIEQHNFDKAIKIFLTSLEIQKSVLGAGNKLVQSTMENLGYAYAMIGQHDKASKMLADVWETQEPSSDPLQEKIETLKKRISCFGRLEQWQRAFDDLEKMEDLEMEIGASSNDLAKTRKLMGEVNYELLKLPSLSNATNRALGCGVCVDVSEEPVSLDDWVVMKPENTSKMSGHRVTHA